MGDRGRCAWEEVGGFGKPWELGYRWFWLTLRPTSTDISRIL